MLAVSRLTASRPNPSRQSLAGGHPCAVVSSSSPKPGVPPTQAGGRRRDGDKSRSTCWSLTATTWYCP